MQVHRETHDSVGHTDAPLPKDVVEIGHLFTRLDVLTKVDNLYGGFPHPACVTLTDCQSARKFGRPGCLHNSTVPAFSY